jgi:hypothetical protein
MNCGLDAAADGCLDGVVGDILGCFFVVKDMHSALCMVYAR